MILPLTDTRTATSLSRPDHSLDLRASPVPTASANWHSHGLNLLRVLSCIAVVLLHLAATIVVDGRYVGEATWHIHNMLDAATRWCVPVFVMLSGALLLTVSRYVDTRDFARRRWRRLGPPIFFWTTVYFLWRTFFWNESITVATVVHDLVAGRPFIHLYFLFLIGGLYIVTPWVQPLAMKMDPRHLRTGIVVMFCFAVGANAVAFLGTSIFSLFVPYLAYYLLGAYCLQHITLTRAVLVRLALVFALAAMLVTALTAILVGHGGLDWRWAFYFYEDFSPIVITMAVMVFLGIVHAPISPGLARAASWCAPLSFGVYLLHPIVVEVLRYSYYLWYPALLEPPLYVAVTLPLALGVTATLVAIMQRVPGLRCTI